MRAFRFIEREKARITTACRVLGVSPSGFHAWRARPKSPRALGDEILLREEVAAGCCAHLTCDSPRKRVNFNDPNDALTFAAAALARCHVVVSQNTRDYPPGATYEGIPYLRAQDLLAEVGWDFESV